MSRITFNEDDAVHLLELVSKHKKCRKCEGMKNLLGPFVARLKPGVYRNGKYSHVLTNQLSQI